MTDDLTDEQAAIRDALIEPDAPEAILGVTDDEQAVVMSIGDVSGYFAPFEVREISMAVTKAYDGLPDRISQTLNHALICAEVVEGEKTMGDAIAETADDVDVSFPE